MPFPLPVVEEYPFSTKFSRDHGNLRGVLRKNITTTAIPGSRRRFFGPPWKKGERGWKNPPCAMPLSKESDMVDY